jgi:hypothetical protein
VTFNDCLMECARNPDLVREFNRLAGCHLPVPGERDTRSPLDRLIDDATGYGGVLESELKQFCEFVWDCVWVVFSIEVNRAN